MTLRQEIGVILGLIGVLANTAHFALLFVSAKPEKYHGHELVVGFGIVLALVGLMLLIDRKQER